MPRDAKLFLNDVLQAIDYIFEFTSNKNLIDYNRDPMLRSAVERQFEIIGEALRNVLSQSPEVIKKVDTTGSSIHLTLSK